MKVTPARMVEVWKLLEHVEKGAHLELFGPGSATPALPCVGRLESQSGNVFAEVRCNEIERLVPALVERWECVLEGDAAKLLELMQRQARDLERPATVESS